MIFWIAVPLFILVGIILSYKWDHGGFLGVGLALAVLTPFVLMLVLASGETHFKTVYTRPLLALETGSNIQGTFFLGTGTVDEEQVFNYVWQGPNKDIHVDYTLAARSVAYEDTTAESATLFHVVWYQTNPWLLPWDFIETSEFQFHIPKGSVVQNYSISAN